VQAHHARMPDGTGLLVALATMLLIGAAVATRSTLGLLCLDRGIDPHKVLTVQLVMPGSRHPTGTPEANYPALGRLGTTVDPEPAMRRACHAVEHPLEQSGKSPVGGFHGYLNLIDTGGAFRGRAVAVMGFEGGCRPTLAAHCRSRCATHWARRAAACSRCCRCRGSHSDTRKWPQCRRPSYLENQATA
jgi:hypothetical protein